MPITDFRFEFATAGRILFGPGVVKEVPVEAKKRGSHALFIRGKNTERSRPLLNDLEKAGLKCLPVSVDSEPTLAVVRQAVQAGCEGTCDVVIGMGGGSVIDTAKAAAALLTNTGHPLDYLEVIGQGKPLEKAPRPCIAVPTTAGTGAEVTRNAVLFSVEHGVKVSLRSPLMLPDLAVVDPDLTLSMPPEVTAGTGLDALTQVLEAFVSQRANPLTDAFCREGLVRAARSLRNAFHHPDDRHARTDMALASLMGGLALANAGLGVVHGFAGPLGGRLKAPHGMICAALLPHGVEANIRLAEARKEAAVLYRFREAALMLTGKLDALPKDLVAWLTLLCRDLAVPGLAAWGLSEDDFPDMVEAARLASSMKGNPVALPDSDLFAILQKAL